MLGILQFVTWLAVAGLLVKTALKTRTVGTAPRERKETFVHIPTAIGGAATLTVLAVLLSSFGTIGAGERGIVQRFGAVTGRTVQPGLYAVTPLVESVQTMNVQVQKDVSKAAAASKDLQTVATEVALNYSVNPRMVMSLFQTVGLDFKSRIIDPAIQEAVKSVTAKYNAENLISERHLVKTAITDELKARLNPLGILVEAVSITDFAFDPQFMEAVEAKVTSTQLAMKAQNDLKRVQFEADQTVATATATAKSIEIQAQAIQSQGGREYVNMKAIEKWNGALPTQMFGSAPVPFINIKPGQ